MDLAELTERAMALHERFAAAAAANDRRAWTREEIMQGFVVDVGDLMKLVMAQAGLRDVPGAEQKLAHELADCLWSLLVLARLYGIDLEKSFVSMLAEAAPGGPSP